MHVVTGKTDDRAGFAKLLVQWLGVLKMFGRERVGVMDGRQDSGGLYSGHHGSSDIGSDG
ncbi:hypothetical protein [Streptomyces sp. NBC_00078]|uniref:hypothetical protein n=1 Tax=unclassified Streptomyces TaxID=2593676 RepID=UPI00224F3C1B|nr:hypothetical protein [Streptomyces sp. NBC_00078]MCX5426052.1 hypothetical protein [Streptomyces sp. NBC_00078]